MFKAIDTYPKMFLLILCLLCIFVGWNFRGLADTNDFRLYNARAWGYDEKENNWNRIRVDHMGYVICNHKE